MFIIENNLPKVGQSFFSLVPSDNHDTRSTCPMSVFTGTGQSEPHPVLMFNLIGV
jgi:hypothetical protein